MTSRLALFALLALGCGAHAEHGPIVLTPTEEMRDLVETAATKWIAATGIEIPIGPGGIPVETADEALDEEGDPVCGITRTTRGKRTGEFRRIERVVLATKPPPGCPGWRTGRSILHELGHVLCEHGIDGWPENGCHTERGLMAVENNETKHIDSSAVEVVCARANCTRVESTE